MIYLDLIVNLTLLIALSIVSGFIDQRWSRQTRLGVLLQGALFGCAAVIGMLRPLILGPGLIFDGRSVMISLCALFFGPWAAIVACLATIACRIGLGGTGVITGVLVILSSAGIGIAGYFRLSKTAQAPSTHNLYLFGLAVHLAMIALMFTLPGDAGWSVVQRIGLPVLLLYPLATILAGKILADHVTNIRNIDALQLANDRFRRFVDSNIVGIVIADSSGAVFEANDYYLHMIGYTREEFLQGKVDWRVITPPEWLAADEEAISELRTLSNCKPYEKEYVRRDGKRVPIFIANTMLPGPEEAIAAFVLDISDRKRAEDALRESEVHFRTLADSGQALIWTAGIDKQCNYFNQPWLSFTGRSPEQELGDGWTQGVHLDDLQRCVEIFTGSFDRREKFSMNYRIRRHDGEYRWIQDDGSPRFNSKGEFIGYIGHCLDITGLMAAEENIRQLNEQLEKKVAERTIELKEAVNYLEEVNRVFVGRELKMAELKARITELEKLA